MDDARIGRAGHEPDQARDLGDEPSLAPPVVTAACAATLDDLAPGRVYIGIGAGGTGVWHLGLGTAKLADLEAYVLAVRGLLERARPTGTATR